ncbi:SDR family oxidoreductase [Rhizobium sullae]|uniref:NmrA family transcriptional regulator n=1 Tax=Rhizobium sullae TaxID=50338 RepID=A0A2N0DFT8_RHISU|nr:SDR family oxidoreductase [Rhizobium sullae]PKA44965.1 NmrA family transcriptional regulator [Rhizobium sullae]
MKIVVIGGTGLIGSKTVARLRAKGHDVLAASPNSGVNTITGEGLDEALASCDVVLDLANSPSFEDEAVLEFFKTAGHNLLAAEAKAGVKHHIALSIVGTERLPESGYMRAKLVQEQLVKASPIPYTIVHSTQFFEFLKGIADAATVGTVARLSPASFQPIASDDVADVMADVVLGKPLNGTIEIAGPERAPMNEIIARYLKANNDPRTVEADVHARYFGTELNDQSLVPGEGARLGRIDFEEWFRQSRQPK